MEEQHRKGLNGDPDALAAERAIEELRRGRAIRVTENEAQSLFVAVETIEAQTLEVLRDPDKGSLTLILTPERCRALDIETAFSGPAAIDLPADAGLDVIRAVAGAEPHAAIELTLSAEPVTARTNVEAALQLAKAGRLLPALLAGPEGGPADDSTLAVRAAAFASPHGNDLAIISRARVPLVNDVTSEIVLFRERYGLGEHLAIVIESPDFETAVPTRLHSACLTGDVLGSQRCDCGEQLKRAISRMASLGGGVLLYLDQEGRGIGLANKLRAYALQDSGLDTVDADQHLGFHPDERRYDMAAAMLHELGIRQIRLMTNNPGKIQAMSAKGIDVSGRLPLVAPVNPHNRRYIEAKLDRAGHLSD